MTSTANKAGVPRVFGTVLSKRSSSLEIAASKGTAQQGAIHFLGKISGMLLVC